MIVPRRSNNRGYADRGWLQSHFTFSFADYYDPAHMGFRELRVINSDRIGPGKGFGPHAHRDMEILTYVVEGQLRHRDSMGEQHTLGPNEIQLMSAGSGIVHSEFNASETAPVRLFQIWILPSTENLSPSYQQVAFEPADKQGRFCLLAGPEESSGPQPLTVLHQDAKVYVALLGVDEEIRYPLDRHRYAWVQVVKGSVSLNGLSLVEGDGAAVSDEGELSIRGIGSGEVLLFDLP
jgi:redox-sensitive bicupin YhaK (pirin superfamily)